MKSENGWNEHVVFCLQVEVKGVSGWNGGVYRQESGNGFFTAC